MTDRDQETNDPAQPAAVADAVRDLERELRMQGLRRWLRRLGVVGALGLVVLAYVGYRRLTAPPPEPRFETAAVETRDIVEKVQSTGTVRPLKEVQVGAQVSGRLVKVHVDFNSEVKQGDLLAEIDQSIFGAQVNQVGAQIAGARAARRRAEAQLATAEQNVARLKRLRAEGLGTQAELEQAIGARDVAKADVSAARAQAAQLGAQLSQAKTNLAYAKIYSPIDGVVINRAVEPGQTVAASFNTPVLFVIAEDLKKMQVLAEIDEADVGRLKEGMVADVVVDAFPGQVFDGKVSQVRFSPNEVQGVVTYSAVVDVANPDLKLRPGMTATVTVKTRVAKGVRAVRNAALRFKPRDDKGKRRKLAPIEHGKGRVFLPAGGKPGEETATPEVVAVGITDGIWTELTGTKLAVGAEVVTEQRAEPAGRGFF